MLVLAVVVVVVVVLLLLAECDQPHKLTGTRGLDLLKLSSDTRAPGTRRTVQWNCTCVVFVHHKVGRCHNRIRTAHVLNGCCCCDRDRLESERLCIVLLC